MRHNAGLLSWYFLPTFNTFRFTPSGILPRSTVNPDGPRLTTVPTLSRPPQFVTQSLVTVVSPGGTTYPSDGHIDKLSEGDCLDTKM